MEPNIINDFIQHIANGVVATVGSSQSGLIPTGLLIARYLVVVACMMMAVSLAAGGLYAPIIFNFVMTAAITRAAIANWATVVLALPGLTRDIGAEIIPGFNGPMTLFASAIEVANRLAHASVSFSFPSSLSEAASLIGAILGSPLVIPAIFLGMISTGVCAIVMEICLLLGAMVGPLLLPFLAFGLTARIGTAYLTFLLYAALEVVMMSALSHFIGAAVIDVIVVPGRADEITNTDVYILLGIGGIMTVLSGVLFYVGGKMVGSGFGTISSSIAGKALGGAAGAVQAGFTAAGRTGGDGRAGGGNAPAWSAGGSSGSGSGGGGGGGAGWAGSGAGWAGSPSVGGGGGGGAGGSSWSGTPPAKQRTSTNSSGSATSDMTHGGGGSPFARR